MAYLDHATRAVGLLSWPKVESLPEITALYTQCNGIEGVRSCPSCVCLCVFLILNNKYMSDSLRYVLDISIVLNFPNSTK